MELHVKDVGKKVARLLQAKPQQVDGTPSGGPDPGSQRSENLRRQGGVAALPEETDPLAQRPTVLEEPEGIEGKEKGAEPIEKGPPPRGRPFDESQVFGLKGQKGQTGPNLGSLRHLPVEAERGAASDQSLNGKRLFPGKMPFDPGRSIRLRPGEEG
jgi:hypothetical protein